MADGRPRFARIALSFVAEPGDLALGALLRACGPAEAFAAICDGRPPDSAGEGGARGSSGQGRAVGGGGARRAAARCPPRRGVWGDAGVRLVRPGGPGWAPAHV